MGWELRDGKRYYYKSVRTERGPRKMYCGNGVAARAHEILDRQAARRRAPAREERKKLEQVWEEGDRLWTESWSWLHLLAESNLLLSGWYRHAGHWRYAKRKPRTRQNTSQLPPWDPTADLFDQIRCRNEWANSGLPGVRHQLQDLLEQHPNFGTKAYKLIEESARYSAQQQNQIDGTPLTTLSNLPEWAHEAPGSDTSWTEYLVAEFLKTAKQAVNVAETQSGMTSVTTGNQMFKMRRLDIALRRLSQTHKLLLRVQKARRRRQFLASLERIASFAEPDIPDRKIKTA